MIEKEHCWKELLTELDEADGGIDRSKITKTQLAVEPLSLCVNENCNNYEKSLSGWLWFLWTYCKKLKVLIIMELLIFIDFFIYFFTQFLKHVFS